MQNIINKKIASKSLSVFNKAKKIAPNAPKKTNCDVKL
jgi:hypothetical protein